MKLKVFLTWLLNIGLAVITRTTDLHAQEIYYRADAQTVVDTVSLQITERLYLSPGSLAPTNTAIWFVADTAADGVSTNPPANQILGGDDILIVQDVVDGRIFGNSPGRYNYLGVPVTNNITSSNAVIYVYLWNGQSASFQPQQGSTFGLYRIGIATAPLPGNAKWPIAADVFANQYTVSEPTSATPPQITQQPTNQTANAGDNVTFSVQASGTPPLTYQWKRGETDIGGATSSSLTLTNVTQPDAGVYAVKVSNSVTNVLSADATLTVNSAATPPTLGGITSQVSGSSLVLGFSFTAASGVAYQVQSATNLATTPIQWSPEGSPIQGSGGAATVSLTNNVADFPTKYYRVEAD